MEGHLVQQDDISICNLLLSLIDGSIRPPFCQLASDVAGIHHSYDGIEADCTA